MSATLLSIDPYDLSSREEEADTASPYKKEEK
jgi:hypothetical protein